MRGPASLSLDSRSLRASVRRGRSSSRTPLQPPMGQGMAGVPGPPALLNESRIAGYPVQLHPSYTNFTIIRPKQPRASRQDYISPVKWGQPTDVPGEEQVNRQAMTIRLGRECQDSPMPGFPNARIPKEATPCVYGYSLQS